MASPRQYMILSLPNSGTDWLCPILAKHGGLRYYDKEFFNPICNPKYGHILEAAFGCELATCYRNIGLRAKAGAGLHASIYDLTWAREDYNFDKENFSAMKVPFFAERFEIVFLNRKPSSVFPPSRLRVWAWYDAIYAALVEVGVLGQVEMLPLAERAGVAHTACWLEMRNCAREIGAPVLDYDLLGTAGPEALAEHLSQGWIGRVVDVPAAVAEIVATRKWVNKERNVATN